MADLVSHLAVVLLPGVLWPRKAQVGLAAVGAALPDLFGRAIPIVFGTFIGPRGLPEAVQHPWGVLHQPLGLALLAGLLGQAFAPGHRLAATLSLLVGCAAHFALDVLQDHHGQGYYLLYPISHGHWELGIMGSEATVSAALPLAGVVLMVWAGRQWIDSRQSTDGSDTPHSTGQP